MVVDFGRALTVPENDSTPGLGQEKFKGGPGPECGKIIMWMDMIL